MLCYCSSAQQYYMYWITRIKGRKLLCNYFLTICIHHITFQPVVCGVCTCWRRLRTLSTSILCKIFTPLHCAEQSIELFLFDTLHSLQGPVYMHHVRVA